MLGCYCLCLALCLTLSLATAHNCCCCKTTSCSTTRTSCQPVAICWWTTVTRDCRCRLATKKMPHPCCRTFGPDYYDVFDCVRRTPTPTSPPPTNTTRRLLSAVYRGRCLPPNPALSLLPKKHVACCVKNKQCLPSARRAVKQHIDCRRRRTTAMVF